MKLSDSKVEIVRRHNKVVYQDGNSLVKVFNSEKPGSDVFNEALNVARVEETGVRVPGIKEVSQVEDGEWKGSWALATAFIPGTDLATIMKNDPGNNEEHLSEFVDLQIKVQHVKAPALNRQKDKLQRMVRAAKDIDPSARYDLEMRIHGMRPGFMICHGDFNPSNVILPDDGSDPAICDWAHVTAGLPEVDAATTYLLMSIDNRDMAKQYLDVFSKKADIAKQVIMYWVPVVAAAELSRNRKENQDFLRNTINTTTDFE